MPARSSQSMIFLSAEEEGVEQVRAYEDGEKPNESSCERGEIVAETVLKARW